MLSARPSRGVVPRQNNWDLENGATVRFAFLGQDAHADAAMNTSIAAAQTSVEDADPKSRAMYGTFLAVEPPRRLEYTWGGDLLQWDLLPDAGATRLVFTHTPEISIYEARRHPWTDMPGLRADHME